MRNRGIALAGFITLALMACGGGGNDHVHLHHLPPAAQLWALIAHALAGTPIQFFGQGTDPDGGSVSYSWDFDGDGVADSVLQSPTHAFPTEGVKTVFLTVTDPQGQSSTARMTVTVFAAPSGSPPNVHVRAFSLQGAASLEVLFRADASDPDGSIVRYDWDFEGDGAIDTTSTVPTAVHAYSTGGARTARVLAFDASGKSSEATVVVSVCPPHDMRDSAPSAAILVEGSLFGSSVKLAAAGSDVEGGSVGVAWILDGAVVGSGRTLELSGLSAGPHRVEVRLVDTDGREPGRAEIVLDPTLAAWAFADTLSASPNTPIQFHARGGLTFAWDFDGDGTVDSTESDPLWAYALPGYYQPEVRVSDGTRSVTSSLSVVIQTCLGEDGPYFWYDCDELVLYHGGTGTIALQPKVIVGGSYPKWIQLRGKAGPMGAVGMGGDAAAAEIIVTDPFGGQAPPDVFGAPPPPPRFPNAVAPPNAIRSITVTSIAVHDDSTKQYTVRIRLEDPGIRVQILKCTVWVIHDGLNLRFSKVTKFGENSYRGKLRAEVVKPQAGIQGPSRPEIRSMEIHFSEQDPKWTSVDLNSIQLPPGWTAELIGNSLRLAWGGPEGSPLKEDGPALEFAFDFTTAGGAPCEVVVRLFDANGAMIGKEHALIVGF